MMRIGVRAHDYGRHAPDELARRIAQAGFETVQLALTKAIAGIERFEDVTDAALDATRDAFAEAGVGIDVLGCYVETGAPDRAERLEGVERFRLSLEHARRLGAPLVATETTLFSGDSHAREARYALLLDSALRIAEQAERVGVTACFEPVAVHTLNSAVLARRLLDDVGSQWVKIVFDPVNMLTADNLPGQDAMWDEYLDLLGADIAAMHIKDVDARIAWRNIGQGLVHYDRILEKLRAIAPDLPLLREEARPLSADIDIRAMRGWTIEKEGTA